MNSKKVKNVLQFTAAAATAFSMWVAWGNLTISVSNYKILSNKLPRSFNGYKIVQVSDLHNRSFGKNNSYLLSLIEKNQPDIIVLTGDLIDSRRSDVGVAVEFARQAALIAPVYYVNGNHESRLDEYETAKIQLNAVGVTVLENESVALSRGDEQITLLGLTDPGFGDDYFMTDTEIIDETLGSLPAKSGYTVMLSHRPHLIEQYAAYGADLVLSGHAHGGQFRVPFVGGVVAPGQGFFPEYDSGVYKNSETTMVVSRGLGNSIIPVRLNNRPELVVVQLGAE